MQITTILDLCKKLVRNNFGANFILATIASNSIITKRLSLQYKIWLVDITKLSCNRFLKNIIALTWLLPETDKNNKILANNDPR